MNFMSNFKGIGAEKETIRQLLDVTSKYNTETLKLAASKVVLTKTQAEEIFSAKGLTGAKLEEAVATATMSAAEKEATASTAGLSAAFTGLKATLAPFAPLLISIGALAATAYTAWYFSTDQVIKRNKELREELAETINTLKTEAQEFDTNADSLEDLCEKLEAAEKGSKEYYEIANQIAELSPSLVIGYTNEGNAILDTTGKIHEQTEAYRELAKAKREEAREQAGENIDTYISQYEDYAKRKAKAEARYNESRELYNQVVANPDLYSAETLEAQKASMETELAQIKTFAEAMVDIEKSSREAYALLLPEIDTADLTDAEKAIRSTLLSWATQARVTDEAFDEMYDKISGNKNISSKIEELFAIDGSAEGAKNQADKLIADIAKYLNTDSQELKLTLGFDDDYFKTAIETIKEGTVDYAVSIADIASETTALQEELTLLQEILSDTSNVSQENYEKLISYSSKYASALRTENGRIVVNATRLKQVAKQRQNDTKATIKQTVAIKKQEWVQWKQKIENYNDVLLSSIEGKYDDITALEAEIAQYELLQQSLDETTNAFQRFKDAQSTNDQDMYDTATDAFKVLKETATDSESDMFGKFNTDDFQEALKLLAGTDKYRELLNTKDMDTYAQSVNQLVDDIAPLFDENNAKSASNLFDQINAIIESGDVPSADKDWASRLGISEDMFHALSQFGNQYGFNNMEIFDNSQIDVLDEYVEKMSRVEQAQKSLSEITDKTSNDYLAQQKEFQDANRELDEFIDSTTRDTKAKLEEFANWNIANGGNNSFKDYLAEQFEYEQSDIDGTIDAVLAKAEELKTELDSLPSDVDKGATSAYAEYESLINVLGSLGYAYESEQDLLSRKLEKYEKLKEKADELNETIIDPEISDEELQSAQAELDDITNKMDSLRKPIQIQLEANLEEVNAALQEVADAKSKLQDSSAYSQQASAGSGTLYEYNQQLSNKQSKLEGQKADIEQTLKIVVDDSEAQSSLDSLGSTSIDDKDFNINAVDNATSVVSKLDSMQIADKTFSIKADFTGAQATINAAAGANASASAGANHADGTVGNAYASGYNGLKSDEKNALRSEYGQQELAVFPDGRYELTDTPTMSSLPKDTVIFNEEQTKRILQGNSHNNGTDGNAFRDGTKTKVNVPLITDVSKNNSAVKAAESAAKATSDAVEEASDDIADSTSELFDWIERRIKNFQTKIDKWTKQAETAISTVFSNKYYAQARLAMQNQLKTYGSAYTRYMAEANSVGLSSKYAKRVRKGTIDIESIDDENLKEKIQKYQDYYDKAIESTTSFVETAEELYNLPLERAAQKVEKFSEAIELLDKQLNNAIGSAKKNSYVDQQTQNQASILSAYQSALDTAGNNVGTTSSSLAKSLSSKKKRKTSGITTSEYKNIQDAIASGTEVNLTYFKEGSSAYNEAVKYNEALKARAQATTDLATAQEDYVAWVREASKIKFDNIADDYEKQIQMIDYQTQSIENKIAEIEASGRRLAKGYYENEKAINDQKLAQYRAEKNALEESIKSIEAGTDEWYEAYDVIQQISSSISSLIQDTYELNNAITQLHVDIFNDIADGIDRIIQEQEFLQGLFAHQEMFNDFGEYTDAGLAKLGTMVSGYYATLEKAENDQAELLSLLNLKESGTLGTFNSLDDLEKRINEVYDTWQSDIKETYDYESDIADFRKEKYEAELDALKELIEAKKESLDMEKALYEYQQDIADKTKSITTIQKQIAAYSGDTSQEAMSRLQKLQSELTEKQNDLRDTEYDKYISDQEDMLDKLYEEYEELIQKKLDDFMALVSESLNMANTNLGTITDYLSDIATDYDYTPQFSELLSSNNSLKESVEKIATRLEANANQAEVDYQAEQDAAIKAAEEARLKAEAEEAARIQAQKDELKRIQAEKEAERQRILALIAEEDARIRAQIAAANALAESKNKGKSGTASTLLSSRFADGGIGKIVPSGEDGIAFVRNGEGFVSPEDVPAIQGLLNSLPSLSSITDNLLTLPKLVSAPPQSTTVGDVNFNIELPNVKDTQSFVSAIQSDKKIQKAIQSVTVGQLAGKGRLSVNSIK